MTENGIAIVFVRLIILYAVGVFGAILYFGPLMGGLVIGGATVTLGLIITGLGVWLYD